MGKALRIDKPYGLNLKLVELIYKEAVKLHGHWSQSQSHLAESKKEDEDEDEAATSSILSQKKFKKMPSVCFTLFSVLLIATLPNFQGYATSELHIRSSSPFSVALETLQKQLGYTFKSIDLLRRAMTHASFSEENNRALSILGANVIETAVSFQSLSKDIDISSKDLNRIISEISKVESSCTGDASRLGLQKVVRVSPKTNSSAPSVVCGAFRAIFGAIAIDATNCDAAGKVFWDVHGAKLGVALPF